MITLILSHLLWILKSITQPLVALNRWAHREYNKICVEMSNGGNGVHEGTMSFQLVEDFPQAGMLCSLVGSGRVKIAEGMDYPVGVALSGGKKGEVVAVQLCGCSLSTAILQVSESIICGEAVYVGQRGGVRGASKDQPGIRVGLALTNGLQGRTVEVDLYTPLFQPAL